ncbi:MAG: 3-hydroxyacyl-ACP dehydratase FabZ family protein [Planctomycetota bacterium]
MPPPLLFDLDALDLSEPIYGPEAIEKINPHRGVMSFIDGVLYEDLEARHTLAYYDVRDDEFWVPGHIPGRPIFPGVLMIEAAAQLASFNCLRELPGEAFMGFAGIEQVKFRGMVKPGDRFYILMHQIELRRRRSVCDAQGVVDGQLVFEGRIIGMPM